MLVEYICIHVTVGSSLSKAAQGQSVIPPFPNMAHDIPQVLQEAHGSELSQQVRFQLGLGVNFRGVKDTLNLVFKAVP